MEDFSTQQRQVALAIKLNSNITPEPCPLCGQIVNPNIGVELTLSDCDLIVCRQCGREHAPALVALLELAWMALDFSLCERDFGEMWQAAKSPHLRTAGLDWNAYKSIAEE